MADLFQLIWSAIAGLFRSRAFLEAEILTLRHQLNVLRRSPKRPTFSLFDRLIFMMLYRIWPGIADALAIVQPETIIAGIAPGFASSGVRNIGGEAGDQKLPQKFAGSSGK